MLKRTSILLAVGACLALAGCGSDDEGKGIPAVAVQQLESRLVETENRLAEGSVGACEDILNDTQPEVGRVLDSLPSDVDPDVRDALVQSFENLWSLVDSECQERQPAESPDPAPTPEPEETETQTTPETTTPEETPPDEQELPPDGDGDSGGGVPGNGKGNGNGNGNGIGNGGGVGPGGADLGGGE